MKKISSLPPQCQEIERDFLGSLLIINNAILQVADKVSPADFYNQSHKEIFASMLFLFEKNNPCDLVTVAERLRGTGKLDSVGGVAYLAGLTDMIPFPGKVKYQAEKIRDKASLRSLIKICEEIRQDCYSEPAGGDELIVKAEEQIFKLSGSKQSGGFRPMSAISGKVIGSIRKLKDNPGTITGVSTGYVELDKMTAGLQPCDLIIIAARPSMGKTALAVNIAQHAAMQNKVTVGIFSLEMSGESLTSRLFSSVGAVNSSGLRTGKLRKGDWEKVNSAHALLSTAPIWIDDSAGLGVLEIRTRARRLKAERGAGLIIVDYMQLMSGGAGNANRNQQIDDISRSLKAMAKELDIPVIALSQLNRSLEQRADKRPQLSDLRESGAIEQDADVIIFVYRDEVYNKAEDNPNRNVAEIIVGKQRCGPTGTLHLGWNPETTTFLNLGSK